MTVGPNGRASLSRRQFCQWLSATGVGAAQAFRPASAAAQPVPHDPFLESAQALVGAAESDSHIGNLYPFVQKQADRSPLELSFLRSESRDLERWQTRDRAKVFEHLFYAPPPVSPSPEIIRRTDKGDYVLEYLTFQTTPDLRVPAYVLVPKNAKLPAPGIVVLHDHGGFYVWGKEKVVALWQGPWV